MNPSNAAQAVHSSIDPDQARRSGDLPGSIPEGESGFPHQKNGLPIIPPSGINTYPVLPAESSNDPASGRMEETSGNAKKKNVAPGEADVHFSSKHKTEGINNSLKVR